MDESPIVPVRGRISPQSKMADKLGISISTFYRWRKLPNFPKPVPIRSRNYWAIAEVEAWLALKRDNPEPPRRMPKGRGHRPEATP